MANLENANGSCLCGAVSFVAHKIDVGVGACHCSMCRKWGGGPLMAVDCGTDVSFDGIDNISVFSSSDWAERGFCAICGSHLFYRLKENGQHIMPVGLLDTEDTCLFDHQVFIDEKPPYYRFANDTKDMTGAEVFAQFGVSSD